jgi:methyl-accepting chemotaxis protein
MSIRAFLAICLVVIGGVMTAMAALLILEQQRTTQSAAVARDLVDALAAGIALSASLAPERGATGVAIATADDTARQTLLDARHHTDAALAEAVHRLSGATFEGKATRIVEMETLAADLAALRKHADALISGDSAGRTSAAGQALVNTINELMARVARFSNALEQTLSVLDAEVARPAAVAQDAWTLRDSAGRQSILFLQAINSGKPASPDLRRQMDMAEGAADMAWQRLLTVADAADSPLSLHQAMANVRDAVLPKLAALRQRVVMAGLGNGAYDLDGATWRRFSAPLLQEMLSIRDAAITEARAVADAKQAHARRDLLGIAALLAFAAMTVAVVVWTVGARVTRPLGVLTSVIARLADGTHDLVVPHTHRSDEMGRLARALEVLRTNALAAAAAARQQRQEAQAKETSRHHLDQITRNFAGAIDTVSAALLADADVVRTNADALTVTAETASQRSTMVAAAAGQATSNVATAASAAEALSASVRDISHRVGEAAAVTDHAVHEAATTGQIIGGLSEAATRIAEVVRLISTIAAQTNLLALNATIEAARAGEAGKGFAVVASEVKALARQTAQATDDIHAHVASIRSETDKAVVAIGGIGKTIGAVNALTATIAAAVEHQGTATREIADNVRQAAAGTAEVSASITQVIEANRNTRNAVDHLVGLADQLSGQSATLRSDVGRFISSLQQG